MQNQFWRFQTLSATNIKTVVMPFVQIMALLCVIYGMNIVDKKVYTIQKVCEFVYPSTFREVKKGGISNMINGFGCVKVSEPVEI